MGVNNKNAQDNIQLKGNKKPLQVLHISKKDTQKKSQDIDNEQTNPQEKIKKENIASKPQIIKDDSLKAGAEELLRKYLTGYVSYIRAEKPFIFPFKINEL